MVHKVRSRYTQKNRKRKIPSQLCSCHVFYTIYRTVYAVCYRYNWVSKTHCPEDLGESPGHLFFSLLVFSNYLSARAPMPLAASASLSGTSLKGSRRSPAHYGGGGGRKEGEEGGEWGVEKGSLVVVENERGEKGRMVAVEGDKFSGSTMLSKRKQQRLARIL